MITHWEVRVTPVGESWSDDTGRTCLIPVIESATLTIARSDYEDLMLRPGWEIHDVRPRSLRHVVDVTPTETIGAKSGQWAVASAQHEPYHGNYEDRSEAVSNASSKSAWLGRIGYVYSTAECVMAGLDIPRLDEAVCQWAHDEIAIEDPEFHVGKSELMELENELRPIVSAWVHRHELTCVCWTIVDTEPVRTESTGASAKSANLRLVET